MQKHRNVLYIRPLALATSDRAVSGNVDHFFPRKTSILFCLFAVIARFADIILGLTLRAFCTLKMSALCICILHKRKTHSLIAFENHMDMMQIRQNLFFLFIRYRKLIRQESTVFGIHRIMTAIMLHAISPSTNAALFTAPFCLQSLANCMRCAFVTVVCRIIKLGKPRLRNTLFSQSSTSFLRL